MARFGVVSAAARSVVIIVIKCRDAEFHWRIIVYSEAPPPIDCMLKILPRPYQLIAGMRSLLLSLTMRVIPRYIFTLLVFFQIALAAAPPDYQTEETAVRALTETLYAHWASKDLDGYCALWSPASPALKRRREALQKDFETIEKIEIAKLDILQVKLEGNRAEVRLDVSFRLTVRTGKVVTEVKHRILACAVEANAWRVLREGLREDYLASTLADTKTEEDRRALLAANPDLMNVTLVSALLDETVRALSRQDVPRASLAQRFAKEFGLQLGNQLLVAKSLDLLGEIQQVQGDYLSALQSHQEGLKLVEALNHVPGMFGMLNNLGRVQVNLGDYEAAIASFQRSLRLLGTRQDTNSIIVLTNLANAYMTKGDYTKALSYLTQSIALSKTLQDTNGQAIALNSLARIYVAQGDEGLAEDCYRQALELRKTGRADGGLADLLSNYGIWLARQGRYEEAHSYYQQALAVIPVTDKARTARRLQNIGNLYRRQRQYDLALQSYEASLALREAINTKEGTSYTLHSLAVLSVDQQHLAQAAVLIERALGLAREVGNPELLWREYESAGKIYHLLNQPKEARRAFDEAITIIEELRNQIAGGEQQQEQFFESKLAPYQGVIEILLAQKQVAEALTYAERAKARVLLDVLQSGRSDIAKALTPSEQEKEKNLQREIASLNTQLYRTSWRGQTDKTQIAALQARLQTARVQQAAFQNTLYGAHPELKVQRGQTSNLDLQKVASTLLDAQTALLEYVVMDEKTYLFVLTQGATKKADADLKLYEIPITQEKLNQVVESFRGQLAQHEIAFAPAAAKLYTQFVKPAAAQLQGKTNLIIVREAGLWELPFQALKNEAGRYLIEDFAISYAPSLTALLEMMKLQHARKQEAGAPSLLAFGNPAFGATGKTTEHLKGGFTPLPSSENEVNQLAKLYGTAQSKIYLGAEAREERLKAEAGKASVLHLATHGILNDASPLYSQIVLAQPDEKSAEDGLLEAWEVMKLDLHAQVVILSACETGRGRIGAGEGVIGLTWAFFVAGAPSIVVSQWKVDAESTSELMQEFHRRRQAREPLSKAEALRGAALKLLANPKYRHPFFWASFSLIGEGQ